MKPILWYFADPMCSWCWGFSPVITRIKDVFGEQISISLNFGGLRPGTTEPIQSALREEILQHWHEVQNLTKQDFLFDNALAEGFVYDTEPASRAVVCFAQLRAEHTLAYFSSIQAAFYTEGRNVSQEKVLSALAMHYDIDAQAFHQLFNSEKMKSHTAEHFKRSRQAGVRGFPTLMWQQGKDVEMLSAGYVSWEAISDILQQRLNADTTH
jgi:putative protein-disulfide isomerase